MKKHNKKIALILALALTLALAIPALAEQTTIQGSYTATGNQVINVELSGGGSTVKAYLNPKGWDAYLVWNDVEEDGEVIGQEPDTDTWLKPSGDITTMPIVGMNKGGSPVAVRASVNGTVAGNFKFVSSVPGEKTTSGLIWLEAKAMGDANQYPDNPDYDLGGDTLYDKKFSAQKVATALNDWTRTWNESTKDANRQPITVKHEDWIKKELFDTSKKAEKTAFTGAFNALKKQGQKVPTKVDKTYTTIEAVNAAKAANPTGFFDEIVVLKKGISDSKQQLCVVPAATDPDESPNYFIARLSGRLGRGDTSNYAKAWNSNDGFGASIIWTFQALENVESSYIKPAE